MLCLLVYLCSGSVPYTSGGQKRVLDLVELELNTIVSHMWVLGTEPRSSARAAVLLTAESLQLLLERSSNRSDPNS